MTCLLTWNIQYGLGCDGQVDVKRIARVAREFADADLYCFQEVSIRDSNLDQGKDENQVAILAEAFPDHRPFFAVAVDQPIAGSRDSRQFGNLILSRLPVLQVMRHLLPRPADIGIKHMQRAALELSVKGRSTTFRIICTHIEANSQTQSMAQVAKLRALHAEAAEEHMSPPKPGQKSPYDLDPRPSGAIICGDFNFKTDAPQYQVMTSPIAPWAPQFADAWTVRHGKTPHAPTCALYDRAQWPVEPHARDFFFVTENLKPRIVDIAVNQDTDASDHQPIRLDTDL